MSRRAQHAEVDADILDSLRSGPMKAVDLVADTGRSRFAVWGSLRRLRSAGHIHMRGNPHGGPLYALAGTTIDRPPTCREHVVDTLRRVGPLDSTALKRTVPPGRWSPDHVYNALRQLRDEGVVVPHGAVRRANTVWRLAGGAP